jgi:hypothetical protein
MTDAFFQMNGRIYTPDSFLEERIAEGQKNIMVEEIGSDDGKDPEDTPFMRVQEALLLGHRDFMMRVRGRAMEEAIKVIEQTLFRRGTKPEGSNNDFCVRDVRGIRSPLEASAPL